MYLLTLKFNNKSFVQNLTVYSLILLGFKMWGNEFNCDGSALEAGLEPFIRWNKKVCKWNAKILSNLHALIDFLIVEFKGLFSKTEWLNDYF